MKFLTLIKKRFRQFRILFKVIYRHEQKIADERVQNWIEKQKAKQPLPKFSEEKCIQSAKDYVNKHMRKEGD